VLDGVVGEPLRAALLDAATEPGWSHDERVAPPAPKWRRETSDVVDAATPANANASSSWGLGEEALEAMARAAPTRVFLARVAALYPEHDVRLMPADALEPDGVPGAAAELGGGPLRTIAPVVANAAVPSDAGTFAWHVDMDPAALDPRAPFAERFGAYVNRRAGTDESDAPPRFVSALAYLNGPEPWDPSLDAETLALDPGTGTGVFVRPAPGRVVLMDQDVTHRVSAPSAAATAPRYSLVLKLLFFPKEMRGPGRGLCRPEWGEPTRFGTAGGRRAPPKVTGEWENDEASE
jgi:probable phosphoglycerate mutase